jgi:hypothetical protein
MRVVVVKKKSTYLLVVEVRLLPVEDYNFLNLRHHLGLESVGQEKPRHRSLQAYSGYSCKRSSGNMYHIIYYCEALLLQAYSYVTY